MLFPFLSSRVRRFGKEGVGEFERRKGAIILITVEVEGIVVIDWGESQGLIAVAGM